MDRMSGDRTAAAMAAVPRSLFLPADQLRFAAADQALRIGHGATCSQPSTVARMLRLLGPRPGHRVLDVGSGSGWTTALLSVLADPGGAVVGVEIEPALVETGRANLAEAGVAGARVVAARAGVLGWPDDGPYDRVLVSAEARSVPPSLLDQLADGGRMVVPVAGELVTVHRSGSELRTEREGTVSFVRLREA